MNHGSHLDLLAHDATHPAVNTARIRLDGRPSLILRWTTPDGVFEGEASPLPGFGDDSFARARASLEPFDAATFESLVALGRDSFEAIFTETRNIESPSARFAVETCVLGRLAQLAQRPLWQLLRNPSAPAPPERLPTSALLDPNSTEVIEHAQRLFDAGVHTFKLKVGHRIEHELDLLGQLRRRLGPDLRLRVDPNSTWTDEEASQLQAVNDALRIEWLEDPTEEADTWHELQCSIPLAADEVLVGEEPSATFLDWLHAGVVVLKPMALGGFSACLEWARIAERTGRVVNVSHFFDGPIALDAAIQLAFAVQSPEVTPGLGLHDGLLAWRTSSLYATTDHLVRPAFP